MNRCMKRLKRLHLVRKNEPRGARFYNWCHASMDPESVATMKPYQPIRAPRASFTSSLPRASPYRNPARLTMPEAPKMTTSMNSSFLRLFS